MSLLWKTAVSNRPVRWGDPGVMTWDAVQEKHPMYDVSPERHPDPDYPEEYDGPNEDHGWAVAHLAHAESGKGVDEDDFHLADDLPFTEEDVPVSKIKYMPDPTNPRTHQAAIGYHRGEPVPPPLLVHRAGEYHVADGHHRANGAAIAGKQTIPAIVAHSPRTDRLEY